MLGNVSKLLLLGVALICHSLSIQTFYACAHFYKAFHKLVFELRNHILIPPCPFGHSPYSSLACFCCVLGFLLLLHHTTRLSVALGTFPREAPTKRQISLHGLTLLIAVLPSALELLKEAIDKAGYTDKIVIGMDVAASEFYRDGKYDLDFKSPDDPSRYISGDELGDLYQSFVRDYPGELLCGATGNQLHTEPAQTLCVLGVGKGGSFDLCFFGCPFSGLHRGSL